MVHAARFQLPSCSVSTCFIRGLASTSEGDEAMEVGLKEYTPVDGEDDDEEEDEDEVEREGEFDELSHKPENGN